MNSYRVADWFKNRNFSNSSKKQMCSTNRIIYSTISCPAINRKIVYSAAWSDLATDASKISGQSNPKPTWPITSNNTMHKLVVLANAVSTNRNLLILTRISPTITNRILHWEKIYRFSIRTIGRLWGSKPNSRVRVLWDCYRLRGR